MKKLTKQEKKSPTLVSSRIRLLEQLGDKDSKTEKKELETILKKILK